MKRSIGVAALLLAACASAPQPYCIPPDLTRAPESPTPFGTSPRSTQQAEDEYARCKEREADAAADAKLDTWLREEEARARKREAEQLEEELRAGQAR